jgi:hypothetical protein
VAAQRPVTAAFGGVFIVLCAVTAALSAGASRSRLPADGSRVGWHYPPVTWLLLLALAAAGATILTQHRWSRPAALLAAIVAAQTAATGLVAIRAWFTVSRFGGGQYLTITPITYAAAVTLAGSAAAVAAAAMLWREPANGWRGLVPARPGYVVAGAAVAVLLPLTWNAATESGDITGLGHIATLTFALPWGAGLAAVGWLRGRAAVDAGRTVTVSAILCTVYVVSISALAYYSTPLTGGD